MPAFADDPPLIADWVRTISTAQRLQYASVVRRLFRDRGSDEATSVTTRELVRFLLAMTPSTRNRAVSALRKFFSYAANRPPRMLDPARDLSKALQRGQLEQDLLVEFQRLGIAAEELARLSWRDIIPPTLGQSRLGQLPLDETLRATLTAELLERLRQSMDFASARAALDAPLLEFA